MPPHLAPYPCPRVGNRSRFRTAGLWPLFGRHGLLFVRFLVLSMVADFVRCFFNLWLDSVFGFCYFCVNCVVLILGRSGWL